MIVGNVSFTANINLHYDEEWDQKNVNRLNDGIRNKLKDELVRLIEEFIVSEPDGTVTINNFSFVNLHEEEEKDD